MSFWKSQSSQSESETQRNVPETIQTSNMDCGPAALKSLLEGFDIPIHYGRLREACQTSIDGTSIDMLESVSNQLGLSTQQVMVPVDHLLLAETDTLPAIAVAKLPNGLTHFLVIWRVDGERVQIMDPRTGRKWVPFDHLLDQLLVHEITMDGAQWYEWAQTDGFTTPLRARLMAIGVAQTQQGQLLNEAVSNDKWFALATLDAAARLVHHLVNAGAIESSVASAELCQQLVKSVAETPENAIQKIPQRYWLVQNDQSEQVKVRGVVLLSAQGLQSEATEDLNNDKTDEEEDNPLRLSAELKQSLTDPEPQPLQEIWRLLREDGLLAPTVLIFAAFMSAIGVTLEILVLRGVLEAGLLLTQRSQRITALVIFLSFGVLMMALEYWLSDTVQRMGRHLDMRLRVAFLSKIPNLGDRYFQSRLISDMTMRAHEVAIVRQFPSLGIRFLRIGFQLLLTTVGIAILIPQMIVVILAVFVVAIMPSLLMQSVLQEKDLRLRTHSSGLSRFYLDGLLGLVTIKAHSAEKSFQNAHEMLLSEWVKAEHDYNNAALWIQAVQAILGTVGAIWIMLRYLSIGGNPAGILLLFYWVLSLPQLGQQFANIALQYPNIRNRVLRILEPLGATEMPLARIDAQKDSLPIALADTGCGMAICMENVHVEIGGTPILQAINLTIKAGDHVAIVGSSGAGKSTLVGLLLGWHQPSAGVVKLDGVPLTDDRLDTVRQQTAWVDPSVQIWNRDILENLEYGNSAEANKSLNHILEQANLYDILQQLPDGMQTRLGEGGGLVAGGEGQRVRLGRSMLRRDARLVILDEPFRGLDRPQRRLLLAKVREHWSEATLIFISHDVDDTQNFDRVVVLKEGSIIEDVDPQAIEANNEESAYLALLKAEAAVHVELWGSTEWRHLHIENGILAEPNDDVMTPTAR